MALETIRLDNIQIRFILIVAQGILYNRLELFATRKDLRCNKIFQEAVMIQCLHVGSTNQFWYGAILIIFR